MKSTLSLLLPLLALGACAEHSHEESHEESAAPTGTTLTSGEAASGHSADDGHGHTADDGHGHAADDGHGHAADDGHGHAAEGASQDPKPPSGRTFRTGRGSTPPPVITSDDSVAASIIEWSTRDVDLGTMFTQEVHDLEFPFEVVGDGPLTIKELQFTCGCTAANILVDDEEWPLNKPIPAGSKGKIAATFESKQFSGIKTSQITVVGNAANMPETLHLRADIKQVFQVQPRLARFASVLRGDLRKNEQPERFVEVTGLKEFEITKWVDLPEWVTIEDTGETRAPLLGNGEGEGIVRKLRVLLNPDIEVGRHSTIAKAETTIGKMIEFQVYAEVSGPARYFPEQIVGFNLVEQGKDPIRKMRIKAAADHIELPAPSFRYEGPEVFDVTLDEAETGKEYELKVQLRPDTEIGRHSGKIFLDWPEGSGIPNREFNVSVLVRKPR